jgi:hypothetical protein
VGSVGSGCSLRNPCRRLQRHAQMTADLFGASLVMRSRQTARRRVIMAAKKRPVAKVKRAVAKTVVAKKAKTKVKGEAREPAVVKKPVSR